MDVNKVFCLIYLSLFLLKVNGVKLSFSQQKVLREHGMLTITCTVDETDVKRIYLMQMNGRNQTGVFPLGKTEAGLPFTASIPPGLAEKANISGSINTSSPTDSKITLTIDTEKIQCSDGITFECSLTYNTNDVANPTKVVYDNGTLAVYDYPSIISLESAVNGQLIEGTSAENKTVIQVGDVLNLQCHANVGGIPETKIMWRITSEEQWIEYQPPNGSEFQSTATINGCGYIRNSTIVYNTSFADRNLGFECFVRVSEPPYSSFETGDNPRFYAAFDICTQYLTVENGKISYTGGTNGSVATLTCNAGYIRNGPENTTCILPDWTPELGTCESQQETSQTTISFPRTSVESVSDGTTKSTSTAMCPYGSYSKVVPVGSFLLFWLCVYGSQMFYQV